MKEFNQLSAVMNVALPIFFIIAGIFGLWLSNNKKNTKQLIEQEGEHDAMKRNKVIKVGSIALLASAVVMLVIKLA